MVEIFEKNQDDNEIKRVVYEVLVAKESSLFDSRNAEEKMFTMQLVNQLCLSLKPLVKTNVIDYGNRKLIEASIHLPYITDSVILSLREQLSAASITHKINMEEIKALKKELEYHRMPWYKKILRIK
jgi:hypothetical protein